VNWQPPKPAGSLSLVLAAVGLLALASVCTAQAITDGTSRERMKLAKGIELNDESKEVIAWAAKTYRVEIAWKNVPYPIYLPEVKKTLAGADPSKLALQESLPALRKAMAKYPRDLLHSVGLTRIILGANLQASGVAVGGYSYPPSHSFIVSIEADGRKNFEERRFHHEIFHLMDRALLGQFAKQDLTWVRLNGPNFKGYQTGDGWQWIAAQQTGKPGLEPEPGFVSAYSMSAVGEDKAEVFAYLMIDAKGLAQKAATDPVLRAKVERMKQLVRQASPKMDARYFDKIANAAGSSLP
jgi:hypothetical protein